MNRRIILIALSAGLAALAADLPKAETLLDGYVKASGGAAAYEALETQKLTSTVEFVGQGIKGKSIVYQSRAGNSLTVLDLGGMGKVLSGVKDGVAWESSAMQGPRIREGEERTQMLRMTVLGGAAKWRELVEGAEVLGEETVEGKDCWKMKSRTKGVSGEDLSWIDKATGLMVKSMTKVKSQMGEVPMETYIREYRKEGALLLPAVTEQKVGPMTIKSTLDEAVINGEIPASQFEPPAEVNALLAKKK